VRGVVTERWRGVDGADACAMSQLLCVTVWCGMLRCVAVCCSVLQRVAACCCVWC